MKHLLILIILINFSCHSTKQAVYNENQNLMINNQQCPEDGVCTLNVLKQKSLQLQTDEFGFSYIEMLDDETNLLVFEYKRNSTTNTEDSNYQEFIYIELYAEMDSLNLENNNLQDAKVTFVRLCFCKGQTGAYKVTSGKLAISRIDSSSYQLELSFTVDEVPQVISTISTKFYI